MAAKLAYFDEEIPFFINIWVFPDLPVAVMLL
jgi:hypothetical protein